MATAYKATHLSREAAQVRAQENELDRFFAGKVTQVTLTDGEKTLTIDVSPRTGMLVVHELLLATIEQREKLEQKIGTGR